MQEAIDLKASQKMFQQEFQTSIEGVRRYIEDVEKKNIQQDFKFV